MIQELPILDLSWSDTAERPLLLEQLRSALYDIGFLYIKNTRVPPDIVSRLTDLLPTLFALPDHEKAKLSKLNSPHFLGYSGFAEETTLGKQDLREQFDLATELPVVYHPGSEIEGKFPSDSDAKRDFTQLYWRLRGPNQWPHVPEFREAFVAYHDAVQELSYRFVHLIEEALSIPIGTFDHFFGRQAPVGNADGVLFNGSSRSFLPPQHRIKLLRYPPSSNPESSQGVGAHKDSSGWLTFLLQVGNEPGLEVLSSDGHWISAPPIDGTFVVNFGNAFEAATEGAVKATTHRVVAPGPSNSVRYSIPFFQGLPLDMTVSEVQNYIPDHVRRMRRTKKDLEDVSAFLDPRWDSLGASQLRKWIRSHREVGEKWYGRKVVEYYAG
ncbi:flavonol synthase-like protein [Teratosphaeria destructans]|uniref:Flavonol synthase-like protein n=1 Tax=Teratosphaeria destructans TaxID=418781 RepID=A0A9W7W084_9PEZI|nr:flavonol synthase-like protein [Teratosphaeria destructans]